MVSAAHIRFESTKPFHFLTGNTVDPTTPKIAPCPSCTGSTFLRSRCPWWTRCLPHQPLSLGGQLWTASAGGTRSPKGTSPSRVVLRQRYQTHLRLPEFIQFDGRVYNIYTYIEPHTIPKHIRRIKTHQVTSRQRWRYLDPKGRQSFGSKDGSGSSWNMTCIAVSHHQYTEMNTQTIMWCLCANEDNTIIKKKNTWIYNDNYYIFLWIIIMNY